MSTEGNNPIILVSFDEKENDLIFEDNQGHCGKSITTKVWRKQPVIWKVSNGADINITNIYPKDGSQNIFEGSGPSKQGNDSWKGIVRSDASGKESYNVDYLINGEQRTADPDLDVQPPPPPTNG